MLASSPQLVFPAIHCERIIEDTIMFESKSDLTRENNIYDLNGKHSSILLLVIRLHRSTINVKCQNSAFHVNIIDKINVYKKLTLISCSKQSFL